MYYLEFEKETIPVRFNAYELFKWSKNHLLEHQKKYGVLRQVLNEEKKPVRLKKIDALVSRLLSLEDEKKKLEKELKNYLGDDIAIGGEYGAYFQYTVSESISYKALYEKALTMLGEKEKEQMIKEKRELSKPHKSTAKKLDYFKLGIIETKKKKLWR